MPGSITGENSDVLAEMTEGHDVEVTIEIDVDHIETANLTTGVETAGCFRETTSGDSVEYLDASLEIPNRHHDLDMPVVIEIDEFDPVGLTESDEFPVEGQRSVGAARKHGDATFQVSSCDDGVGMSIAVDVVKGDARRPDALGEDHLLDVELEVRELTEGVRGEEHRGDETLHAVMFH